MSTTPIDAAIISVLITRLLSALTLPNLWEWGVTCWILLGYGAIALPIGFSQGFLQFNPWRASRWHYGLLTVQLFFMPALVEELIFRVLLLPHPKAGVTWQLWTTWAIVSLILFIVYHPLEAKTYYKQGSPTFFNPVFLTLAGLLGVACTLTYQLTGSLLTLTVIHWIVTTAWLTLFGGMEQLHPQDSKAYGQ
ncbi:MAG: CPBP family intramembrane metalloprotease [Leptolyngbyaceae cyanobacterium RU_5_1]|nr:CPBP family intramembrane metalloprotease [Leptolyngbyaceae cyanobacterium RU_5_1]